MPLYDPKLGRRKTKFELVGFLITGFAVASVLTIAATQSFPQDANLISTQQMIVAAAIAVAGILGLAFVAISFWSTRKKLRAHGVETRRLQRNLATAEAMIRAEPQALIFWEQARPPQVVTHTLIDVPGVPKNHQELLRFNFWLEAQPAQTLKTHLDNLFAHGTPFNVIVKTNKGTHVEADGRAAGGRAVLRLRNTIGYKEDLAVVFDQHAKLARDIRASRVLLDQLDHPAWLRGNDGRLIWVNKPYASAVDAADVEDVLGAQIELLESRQRKTVQATLQAKQVFKDRLPLVIGGARIMHEVHVITLDDAVAGIAVNVEALETAQTELDRYVETYDRTLDRVATAVAVFGPQKQLSFFNEAYQKLWELPEDWLQTKPTDGDILDRLRELGRLPEVVHYREWREKILKVYEAGNEIDDWWHLPDGRILHVMAEQRPDGGTTYLYVDETERLQLESRYNALISTQSETLNSLNEAVAVFGTDGRLALANAAFMSVWKLSRSSVEEKPHIDQFVRDASVLCEDAEALQDIRDVVTAFSDQREALNGQMIRSDQSVIDYASIPLPDGGTLLTFADVTDSKRYERALEERNEALVAADKLKNRFIGNVSYELRTPLTNIIGFSEFLASPHLGDLNDKQREYLGDITNSSKTLLSIIDGLLDLATMDAGELQLDLSETDPNIAIDGAIENVRQAAARAQLTLDIAVADDVTTFIADQARITQVLSHLLSNAIGFSEPQGTVEVSCWSEHGHIHFSVEDHGAGIPEDKLSRIFDRFETHSHGSKHRGAGLGLAVVKTLVELHDGSIDVDSKVGRGTRITVRFPVGAKQDTPSDSVESHDGKRAYS